MHSFISKSNVKREWKHDALVGEQEVDQHSEDRQRIHEVRIPRIDSREQYVRLEVNNHNIDSDAERQGLHHQLDQQRGIVEPREAAVERPASTQEPQQQEQHPQRREVSLRQRPLLQPYVGNRPICKIYNEHRDQEDEVDGSLVSPEISHFHLSLLAL